MTDGFEPVLTDASRPPTDAVIATHLGSQTALWNALFERIRSEHPDVREEWRFYRDGGSWLLKITRGSRTICWISVHDGGFRLTVYLPARAGPTIAGSSLRDDLQHQFEVSTSARTRGMTVVFNDDSDVDAAMALIALRTTVK